MYPAARRCAHVRASRDKIGVRGKSRKSASAGGGRDILLPTPGSWLAKSNVVQRNRGGHKFVLSGIWRRVGLRAGKRARDHRRPVRLDGCPPSVIPQGCLVQLRAHTEMNALHHLGHTRHAPHCAIRPMPW